MMGHQAGTDVNLSTVGPVAGEAANLHMATRLVLPQLP